MAAHGSNANSSELGVIDGVGGIIRLSDRTEELLEAERWRVNWRSDMMARFYGGGSCQSLESKECTRRITRGNVID